MELGPLIIFSSLALQQYGQIDVSTIQKFILRKQEVGKVISEDDIQQALELMSYGGLIQHYSGSGCQEIFVRK